MAIDIQRVNAGSAVAIEPHHGNLTTAYGGPVAREKQLALPTLANFSAATATIRRFRRGRLWRGRCRRPREKGSYCGCSGQKICGGSPIRSIKPIDESWRGEP
jgi:hypothetical protein